jgi:hypothetical protein
VKLLTLCWINSIDDVAILMYIQVLSKPEWLFM